MEMAPHRLKNDFNAPNEDEQPGRSPERELRTKKSTVG
jgi:hypothetical protein